MSLEQAFLADVAERPDDDAPRLIYADWLQDNGDPDRAELIRAQCELAGKRVVGGKARRAELKRRVDALFQENGGRWARAFGDWCPDYLSGWSRGFPDHVRLGPTLTALAQCLPALVAVAPIQSVFLDVRSVSAGEGATLAACPALAGLRRLTLWGDLGGGNSQDERQRYCDELSALLRSPHLRQLRKFESVQLSLDNDALTPLLTMEHLESLRFYSNRLDDQATRLICKSPLAARLTELMLAERITARTARTLAQTPALANLKTLDLDQGGIGDTGARHLAGAAHLAGLRSLRLYSNDIGDAGVAALAASPYLTRLRELVLSRNRVLYAGARSLIASKTLPRGMYLDLWDNELNDYTEGIRRGLAKRFRKVNYARSC
jgi:uncharacterized protein (TIGR02996 family)